MNHSETSNTIPTGTEFVSRIETMRPPARRSGAPGGPQFAEKEPRTNDRLVARLRDRTRSAEERYRALFENANDAIAIVGTDGVIVEANRRSMPEQRAREAR